ncbi:tubulin polymerization-promoting protein homolog isoform X1 [Dermatophagoides pteronyssinus]|uniref:TPPP family protein CG45057-like isoform X2 n=2 Tax=Dermatophagoides pteronyssinus TaxID=6956 RepID=A0A6P6Y1Y1_DERPT|nr:TPPP family protein CG45057-like isoform X2 [Dermatophagoides pteronyssinus]
MMAQIDAHIKQPNGSIETILDLSNDDEKSRKEIQTISDRIEQQNLNDNNDVENCNNKTTTTESSSNESFVQLFKMFAKFGDCKSTGETITLSNSDKWFKQAKIIDPSNRTITTTDTGIYFKQVSKTKKTLNFKEFNLFLEKLATVKKIDLTELKNKLQQSGPPATNKTTTAVTSGAIGRLTDHTKYTGSHKQRFDESGKGRGKAGRVDVTPNTGYVSGFKSTT